MAPEQLGDIKLNMQNETHSYYKLQQQIHQDLRVQHPEWVQPNGDCPMCESYELRLAELLGLTRRADGVRMKPSRPVAHAYSY